MRGSERGARTSARWPSRPNASLPESATTMLRLLLRMRGKGCAGSRPSGDSTGRISLRKYSRSQLLLARVPLVAREQAHAGLAQRRAQASVPAAGTAPRPAPARGSRIALAAPPAGPCRRARGAVAEFEQLVQRGHPDLEELVEVGAGDAQEAQPLEQRRVRVPRLRQHAEVELELRQLAVDVQLRVARLAHSGPGRRGRVGDYGRGVASMARRLRAGSVAACAGRPAAVTAGPRRPRPAAAAATRRTRR